MKHLHCLLGCMLFATASFAQLQIKPHDADTMSNATLAKWYTNKYRAFLSLSPSQEKKMYKILLDNKDRLDSLRRNPSVRTEDLAANTFSMDEQLKAVLSDAQYYDYLRTSQIMEWPATK